MRLPFRRRRPVLDPLPRPVADLAAIEGRRRAAQEEAQRRLNAALGLDDVPRRYHH